MDKEPQKMDDIIRRLDVISIFLLSQKGFTQKEIGKILGISHDKIQAIYGKSYAKIQPKQDK